MALTSILTSIALLSSAVSVSAITYENPLNDYSCTSTTHPNPVVLLHGLGATYYEDINVLESFLTAQGFCTFSLTYGAVEGFPWVGGLEHISTSASEIAAFISKVARNTNAAKIDLLGHSEGAFQSLYVPKYESSVSGLIERVVAIAPPTHGTSFDNLMAILNGADAALDTGALAALLGVVCPACDDLVTPSSTTSSASNKSPPVGTEGAAILQLAYDGAPIVQPGTKVTVIASKEDELVTPPTTAFIANPGEVAEGGSVNNVWVQDYCASDVVGHLDEGYDANVWEIVLSALEDDLSRQFTCVVDSFPARLL